MIVIIYYIFLTSFGTTKGFKFQIYYSNSHSLKEEVIFFGFGLFPVLFKLKISFYFKYTMASGSKF